ncbi:MAG: hypothetical protein ABID45_01975, partial [Patescibacteria group bacterium]
MPICSHCKKQFKILEEDKEFLDRFEVPEPVDCPECRLMNRLTSRNAKNLYKRKCDFSGKEILSQYHASHPFPVYETDIWFGDKWDALDYGQDFDFSRPFFNQIRELEDKVPHMSRFIISGTLDNSEYTNCTGYLKNCYLIGESDYDEECYYGNRIYHSKNVLDSSVIYKSELLYECLDCYSCFNLFFSSNCRGCHDSYFLYDCKSCKNCLGCINQRYGEYMILNKKYSKQDYESKAKELKLNTKQGIEKFGKQVDKFFKTQPHKHLQVERNENCIGDNLYDSKNAYMCFDSEDLENCRYCAKLFKEVKNCMDYNSWGDKAELIYFSTSCGNSIYNLKFCDHCMTNSADLEYCIMCNATKNCFGCVGLNKKEFCIFNKQYSEEDYNKLKQKIINYMKENGDYGQFFPRKNSNYGYNETIAMDYFPLEKEAALKHGFKWHDENLNQEGENRDSRLQQNIMKCDTCNKNFNIIKQEKDFYKKQ